MSDPRSIALPLVLLAEPTDPRVGEFLASAERCSWRTVQVRPWEALLTGAGAWAADLPASGILRIDTPGRRFATYRGLLCRGASAAAASGVPCLSAAAAAELAEQPGRILYPDQWYLGLCAVLDDLERFRQQYPSWLLPANPGDIQTLFCKATTHARLRDAGVPVPSALPTPVGGYEELVEAMRTRGLGQTFVKLRHGSAASGIVAYRRAPGREVAYTTVEMDHGELFNTRRVRRLEASGEIRALVDALCRHRVHTEAWIPKAAVNGRPCDVRVLAVAGEPTHWVLRTANSPITNLHLSRGLGRASIELLRNRMAADAWDRLVATCRVVAGLFPASLQLALDVAVAADLRRHYVLEVNAFGDYLNQVLSADGRSPYETELEALCRWNPP